MSVRKETLRAGGTLPRGIAAAKSGARLATNATGGGDGVSQVARHRRGVAARLESPERSGCGVGYHARKQPLSRGSRKGTAMDLAALFSQHVERLQVETEKAIGDTGFGSLVVSSGAPFTYFADDRDAPFEPIPHFAHWCPLDGPHHLLHLAPGRKPRLVRHAPEDYWYEQGGVTDPSGWGPSTSRRRARSRPPGRRSGGRRTPPTSGTRRSARPRPASR